MTKAMNKKLTGVIYTAREFRKLNQCLRCGKVSDIEIESLCDECKEMNLSNCEICEIVLRKGIHKFYTYNTKDRHLEDESDLKPNTKLVKEYCVRKESLYPQFSETLCSGCADWESQMKNKCWCCRNVFENSKENYKLNGNMCVKCMPLFELNYDEEIIYN